MEKITAKGTTFMKRVANQNPTLQYYQLLRSLEEFAISCRMESEASKTHILLLLQPISITDQEIVEMILFPIVNEACRVLEEGIVIRASDLDIASVLGMSFPSYRYAPFPSLNDRERPLQ
ncbi:peroxisomal fatty acid beta-oxidation multifunctional protein AIM1-like [Trifolium medium]|uniref:Peroxisomal fatty acid beta-oxidation multifunctional protein AIM1-like n=1 Tax=Trifolium medium TaxID=97028 RepID=A0A392P335_9FABA|nr:peroxisomal fatty acid beta-oxidation multifunctional protein AIM1-like [Trifolium medium]